MFTSGPTILQGPLEIQAFGCHCGPKTCVKLPLSRTPGLGLDAFKTLARSSAGLWPVKTGAKMLWEEGGRVPKATSEVR